MKIHGRRKNGLKVSAKQKSGAFEFDVQHNTSLTASLIKLLYHGG